MKHEKGIILQKEIILILFFLWIIIKVMILKNNANAIYCSPNFGPCFCGNNNPTVLVSDNSDIKGGTCCKQLIQIIMDIFTIMKWIIKKKILKLLN